MTEQFCGNGHTVNAGEETCLRCGTAVVKPEAPVEAQAEASSEEAVQADAGTATETAEPEQATAPEGGSDDAEKQEAPVTAAEAASQDSASADAAEQTTESAGSQPGDLASQMEAEHAQS